MLDMCIHLQHVHVHVCACDMHMHNMHMPMDMSMYMYMCMCMSMSMCMLHVVTPRSFMCGSARLISYSRAPFQYDELQATAQPAGLSPHDLRNRVLLKGKVKAADGKRTLSRRAPGLTRATSRYLGSTPMAGNCDVRAASVDQGVSDAKKRQLSCRLIASQLSGFRREHDRRSRIRAQRSCRMPTQAVPV